MRFSARRNLLLTTSAVAMGAAFTFGAAAPAQALCTTTVNSVVCSGTENTLLTLSPGQLLTNNGQLLAGVYAEGNNFITNPQTISNSVVLNTTDSELSSFAYAPSGSEATDKTALYLGSGGTLFNGGTISASAIVTATYADVGADQSTLDYSVRAIGVLDAGNTNVFNTGTISAVASHSLSLTDVTNIYSNQGSLRVEADGIVGAAFDPIFNDLAISATASQSFVFDTVSNFVLNGPTTIANGIMAAENLVTVNTATITATATTIFDFTSASSFEVYGPYGSNAGFAVSTSFAAGVQAFYNANVTNNGTINSTASLVGKLTDTAGRFDAYCCDGYSRNIGATAFGVYIGPRLTAQGEYFNFGSPSVSYDTVTNTGTINATALSNFTVSNSGYIYLDTYSTAVGIAAFYPGFDAYSSELYEGWVRGVVNILNIGTINATASTTLALTNAAITEGGGEFYLDANAVGIIVGGGEGGIDLSSQRLGIGGAEGVGANVTITNMAAIKAVATVTATVALSGSESTSEISVYNDVDAIGILAQGFYDEYGEQFIGPTVLNTGTITVSASSSLQTTVNAGSMSLYAEAYADATGIAASPGGSVTNTGTLNVTTTAILSAAVSNQGSLTINGTVDASAYGVDLDYLSYPCCGYVNGSNVTNTGSISATALASITLSLAGDSYGIINGLNANSYAVGIGGAEGSDTTTVLNSGSIAVLATSSVSITGDFYLENSIGVYATAYGITIGGAEGSTVTNLGSINVAALSSFTATLGVEQGLPSAIGMSAYAVGIEGDDAGTITNGGTISVTAAVNLTVNGFIGGGEISGESLTAHAIGIVASEGNQIINTGTITAQASVVVNTPNTFYDNTIEATARGIAAWGNNNTITNSGTIAAIATINVAGTYEISFEPGFFNHNFGNNSAPARAFGIRAGYNNTIVNTGTIIVESSVTLNGTTLSGNTDPSASFGIFARYDAKITNQGLIATTRIGPHHWAVFMDASQGSSVFDNLGSTIGSQYIGATNTANNYGTMTFRVLPTPGGVPVAEYGTYDRIVVGNLATFDTTGGKLVIAPQGNTGLYGPTTTYRYFIDNSTNPDVTNVVGLTAGANVNLTSTSAYLVPTLVAPTDPASSPSNHTGYDLVLTRIPFTGPMGTDLVGNQISVGSGLEGAFTGVVGDPNGEFGKFLGKIQALPPGTPAGAYQQLAGEITSNLSNIGYSNAGQLLGLLFGRLGSLQGGFLSASSSSLQVAQPMVQLASASSSADFAQAPPGAPNSRSMFANSDMVFWMSGYGQTASVDSQPGITGVRSNVAGAMVGAEKLFSENFKLGVTVGGGAAWSKLKDDIDSRAKGKFFQGALYGSYAMGAWYVDGAAGYAYHRVNTERTVGFTGFADRLEGDVSAHQFIGGVETGYNLDIGGFRFTPFVGLQATVFRQDGYSETGGAAALRYGAETTTSVRGLIGAQFRSTFMISDTMRLDPYLRAAWAHEFADRNSTVSASFLGAPSSSFAVQGAERSRDAALIGGGFELTTGPMFSLFAAYSGEIAKASSSHAGTVGFKMRW